ncbi:MAG TPA: HAD-IIIA family hydrolase [Burkholderiales bacterium]|jgi:histidinol-phosphate phosphatase family protein|nr:HAD-IIIA family hydrolase [Burkholderiales bacterium]
MRDAGSGAVFLDKDGTILDDVPYNVDPARMRLAPGAHAALTILGSTRMPLIVVSNQAGVAHGRFAEAALQPVELKLARLFADRGARLAAFLYCPHHPDGSVPDYAVACDCRKPAAGMLQRAAAELKIDLACSWMVGDILDDIEAGRRAGCTTILVDRGNETEWRRSAVREPHFSVAGIDEAARLISAHVRTRPALEARVG